jgi:DNA-directed RNA polymerase II subunit RPB1
LIDAQASINLNKTHQDEMNMHLPQSLQSEYELINQASVRKQILSPKDSKPLIAVKQDVLTGLFKISDEDTFILSKQYSNILSTVKNYIGDNYKYGNEHDDMIKMRKLYDITDNMKSGKELLSYVIPKNINMTKKNKFSDPDNSLDYNAKVVIHNGMLKQGMIDGPIFQDNTSGLIHMVHNDNGTDETCDLFNSVQKIVCSWLIYNGFSVGLSDIIVEETEKKLIADKLKNTRIDAQTLINKLHSGTFENESLLNNKYEYFESEMMKMLDNAKTNVQKIAMSSLKKNPKNRILDMINSGSKGSAVNIGEICGVLGPQNISGKRVPHGFDHRTLPHFPKFDDSPEANGFVSKSFLEGLLPHEFFFHAIAGREGLIDTAVGTAEVGYIQRKMIKALEDCKVNNDMTVRDAAGNIVQFLYGEDGMSAISIEHQKLHYIAYTVEQMEDEYLLSPKDDLLLGRLLSVDATNQFKKEPKRFEMLYDFYKQVIADKKYLWTTIFKSIYDMSVQYPISLERILNSAVALYITDKIRVASDLNPIYVLEKLKELEETLIVSKTNKGNCLLMILLRCYLSPKRLIKKYNFSKDAFDNMISIIKLKFVKSLCDVSEMVGVVAAQSVGEPLTQANLNTFHTAGRSSTRAAQGGMGRVKELLSNSANLKTPMMEIYIKDDYNTDVSICNNVLNKIKKTLISDIIDDYEIIYCPIDKLDKLVKDNSFLKMYNVFEKDNKMKHNDLSPWLLVYKFNKDKMYQLNITMIDIGRVVNMRQLQEKINIKYHFTDDNDGALIMRINMTFKQDSIDILSELKNINNDILNIDIKGVSGIIMSSLDKQDTLKYNNTSNTIEKTFEWVIYTRGVNLIDILKMPIVDKKRTICNDIRETYKLFGIEAARTLFIKELNKVLESSNVNYRHISLLSDIITSKGQILSIDRHGLNKSDIGPLAKCSFEETGTMLINAGIFGEFDPINGISANVMLGQIAPCGTGDTKIMLDLDYILASNIIDTKITNDKSETFDSNNETECTKEKFTFTFTNINENEVIYKFITL